MGCKQSKAGDVVVNVAEDEAAAPVSSNSVRKEEATEDNATNTEGEPEVEPSTDAVEESDDNREAESEEKGTTSAPDEAQVEVPETDPVEEEEPAGNTVDFEKAVEMTITGYSVEQKIVMYNVIFKNGDLTLTFKRRFNDFRDLHSALASESLPEMPRSGVLSFVLKKNVRMLESRKAAFQSIVTAISTNENALKSTAFLKFLN